MDPNFKFPGSPGTPLFQVSPERVNQQRPSTASSVFDEGRHTRESSVHEKVAVFNSLAYQGKQLERKTNDAALKRAILGREEAESEMRRYREETRSLRRQIEEGNERERRVGERLENVMVSISSHQSCRFELMGWFEGELWSREGDTRAYAGTLGERDTKGAQRVF